MARPIADLIHFNSTTVTASGDVYYGPGGGTGIGPIARPIEHGLDSSTENGWQEFESYADLGVDPRRYVPLQVKEKRREIELQFRDAEKKLEASVQAELDKADAALGPAKNLAPLDVINRSLTIVGNALQQKNQKLLLNQKKITSLGAKNFLTRTAEEIGEQAVREGNINGPEAYMRFLDREMEGLTAAYNVKLFTEAISSLQIRMNTLTAAKASIEAAAANKAREQAAAEAKRKAEEQARQQAAIRAANTYAMPANGSVVATAAGRGLIQVAQGAASLAQAISDAIAVLGRVLASAPSVMAVGFASLTYSSRTAEQWQDQTPDSVRYALGMDAAKLGLPPSVNLNAVAKASGTVDLPMRLTNEARGNTTTLSVVSTDGVSVPKAVPVRMAAYNATTGLYEVTVPSTTAEAPPLILTWTPASPPGNQNPSSTTPVVPKPVPVYEGATLTPVKATPETYPGVITLPEDLIIGFPADSGIKPIYVMFRDPRDVPGAATGKGQPVSGNWLGAASQGEGAPIPSQIADKLRGKTFKNWRDFREQFWIAVANDPELSKQFNPGSLAVMRDGGAPYVRESEQAGGRTKIEIHHKVRIADGGGVYNMGNLVAVTPKRHIEIHKGGK
ncbi:TPA: pyocin-S1 [Pseudomonas aeruginosa]|uniref:pyocin-S1 n=1 Tax=Pseudomonas aeruginosa TaxID=287 RepID=UPI00070EE9C5|nr:pyocin-S1 [Pseudomonas aeruginosa]EIU7169420.1 S-type pyocin domain-containing protein [Pseudomonas aeruginosa]KSR15662.1 Pyocin-S1 [Pseudomonas aeruginosa]MBG5866738.1 S-type pyocin domain-containing protein [Pseudomonas aeruginosa]HCD9062736.1 S-type pyocin domain-containing protein [Pseudomonas aeruginosa]HDQ4070106.1 S-type pyocin domain-containing protein [Pseudomonas aeruginosa]